ncbi:hypothetical protein Bca52824_027193 [Brassica carinata]|uniref:Uncharacterized protein n=1 Tax=Brassica carinata TaxID=52824 RepID=A0A8X7SJ16_BRACI|nr:hypothetical protein Bca52824_027193 [Brassica carinata]
MFRTNVINFIEKDFGEMFPRWEFDAEDSAADNIIKVMFNSNPKWKWTMDCWEVNQMNEVIAAETLSGLKEDSGRPRKKARKGGLKEARKEAPVEAPKDEIEKSLNALAAAMRDGFEMCLKEIKLLGDRLEAVEKKTNVINFIEKDFGEMFPRWEFDAEDSAADNIIKVMFNSNPKWKWTMDCWEVNQMNEVIAAKTLSGLKEDSGRPRKKARKGGLKEARKEAPVEAPKDEIEKSLNALAAAMRDGFEMCLKEIKLLGDRLEAVEKKVGITKNRTSGSRNHLCTNKGLVP